MSVENLARYPHLARSGKTGTLRFRRSVPPRLRPFIGKRELVSSLGTADLREALPRYHQIAAEADNQLKLAELTLAGAPITVMQKDDAANEIGPPIAIPGEHRFDEIAGMASVRNGTGPSAIHCRQHYLHCLARERAFRREALQCATRDPEAFWRSEMASGMGLSTAADPKTPTANAVATLHARRLVDCFDTVHALLRALDGGYGGLPLDRSPHAQNWGFGLLLTELMLMRDLLEDDTPLQSSMHAAPTPAPAAPAAFALAPTPPSATQPPTNPLALSIIAKAWVKAKAHGRTKWSEERRRLCERVLADFIEVCGDKPIGVYKKADGRAFLSLLRQLPANIDKRLPQLGLTVRALADIAAAAEARGLSPQDDASVNKKIGIVHQCFRWIMAHYDECTLSPVDGMKLEIRRNAKDEKDPFTISQLNAMFTAPVYTGCASEYHWSRPGAVVLRRSGKFWIPLIALFSGMRLGEICQLSRAHIREHNGIFYFALTRDLRLKNAASVRSVPVHATLIACGLLEFVASCEDRLFPDLPPHASGRFSDTFSKHFARFLKTLGIKTERCDFHSLRHNFVAAADASGVEFASRERILGHTMPGQAGRYGKSYELEQQDLSLLEMRNQEVQKLCYPDLTLDHLAGHRRAETRPTTR